jgi:uncharacterized protein (TIGR02391 family)
MSTFANIFPDVATLLQLEPEDIGPLILEYLNGRVTPGQQFHRHNFVSQGFEGELSGYAGAKLLPEVQKTLSEGWNWLEREGLIALSPNDGTGSVYLITRRGQRLRTRTDFAAFKRGSLLGHHTLDPVLAQKVLPLFIRGDYDTAVFQAFKEVEIRVRAAANFPAEKLGTDLMREAFHPQHGPLTTDKSAPKAERESCGHLFAGAIGLFKNPTSHRHVGIGPEEASELILFANYLLRRIA